MAGTLYTEIFDLFLMRIKDWALIALYNNGVGEANLNSYLQGFLVLAIPEFSACDQDLTNRDDTLGTFNIVISSRNKAILSLMMVKKWLDKEIRDVTQMALHVQDRNFKTFAEANNLTAKQEYAILIDEEIGRTLSRYKLSNINWDNWESGIFR